MKILFVLSFIVVLILIFLIINKLTTPKSDLNRKPKKPFITITLISLLLVLSSLLIYKAKHYTKPPKVYSWEIHDMTFDMDRDRSESFDWFKRVENTYFFGYNKFDLTDEVMCEASAMSVSESRPEGVHIRVVDSNKYDKDSDLFKAKYLFQAFYFEGKALSHEGGYRTKW